MNSLYRETVVSSGMDAIVKTDVLVIGSGVAGLSAALEARRRGVEVYLVSKSPIGLNSCSSYSMGILRIAAEGFTQEEHLRKTFEGGKYLNNYKLVETMVREAPQCLSELKSLGVAFQFTDGRFRCTGGPPVRFGEGLTHPLKKAAINSGVEMAENTMILDLIKVEGTVTGVIAINTAGELTTYSAKAVVLACGGAGQLYSRNDNPVGTTGDGYALALRAGVELVDMEFIQFYPIGLAEKGLPPYFFSINFGVLRNTLGDPLLERLGFDMSMATSDARDLTTRAIYFEIRTGSGHGETVLLDLTEVSEETFQTSPWFITMGMKLLRNFSYRTVPIHVAPLVHHTMGGIRINERTETTVRGLFAAGEVAGGVHGANRIGGNALTDAMVFGSRAGRFSSEYALSVERVEIEKSVSDGGGQRIADLFVEKDEAISPRDLKKSVQSTMWRRVGAGRTAADLMEGIGILTELKRHSQTKLFARNYREVRAAFEVLNMLDIAEAIARAALSRTETRGAHYRLDYPEQDRAWRKNIVVSLDEEGKVRLEMKPVINNNFLWAS